MTMYINNIFVFCLVFAEVAQNRLNLLDIDLIYSVVVVLSYNNLFHVYEMHFKIILVTI